MLVLNCRTALALLGLMTFGLAPVHGSSVLELGAEKSSSDITVLGKAPKKKRMKKGGGELRQTAKKGPSTGPTVKKRKGKRLAQAKKRNSGDSNSVTRVASKRKQSRRRTR